tara:strand:- start:20755 stop:22164 length:1410 start_codon:yes stop_codon:yes gene_type:complete
MRIASAAFHVEPSVLAASIQTAMGKRPHQAFTGPTNSTYLDRAARRRLWKASAPAESGINENGELVIETPAWAEALLAPARYKGIWGGRGSGKSHERGESLIEAMVMNADLAVVCLREVQKSIKMSVKRLLEQKIRKMGVGHLFDCQDKVIKRVGGEGLVIFEGMQNHTADSIKSLEGFDIAWFEEAQNASQRSLDLLRPTIRKPGSELWFTWNPRHATDPIDVLLRGPTPPPSSVILKVNYMDNPWFPEVLQLEMQYDKGRDVDKYGHIWLGGYVKNSEARVFKNWREEEFETPLGMDLRFGADWGFGTDPTVLVRSYVVGRTMYIDYEAYQVGCEIVDTPALFLTVPDSEKWPIVADSARPETISHVRKHGFPKILKAVKGAGSLEQGVEWLKSYDIVVHSRCKHTIEELTLYQYAVDPITDLVLPVLKDKDNHVIDALRYASEADRRTKKANPAANVMPRPMMNRW